MVEELLIHKPDDPIQFLIDHLKQNNDDGKWKLRHRKSFNSLFVSSCLKLRLSWQMRDKTLQTVSWGGGGKEKVSILE